MSKTEKLVVGLAICLAVIAVSQLVQAVNVVVLWFR